MHQFVFLGSFLFLSFQMVSRALKDHIWLVADAFSKKKKQKKKPKKPPQKWQESLYSQVWNKEHFHIVLQKKTDITYKNKENAPVLAYFMLP